MHCKRTTVTIALAVILVSSLFVGLTVALRTPPTDPITQILNILTAMQPQVQNTNNKVNALGSAAPQSLIVSKDVALTTPYASVNITLLPLKNGVTYSGSIAIRVWSSDPNQFVALYNWVSTAQNPPDLAPLPGESHSYSSTYDGGSGGFNGNLDFTCQRLDLALQSISGSVLHVRATLQYWTSTNVTTLP